MELPLFPLQTVLYPGVPIPLQVFEDRYRQLFARVLDGGRRFGVAEVSTVAEAVGEAAERLAAEASLLRRELALLEHLQVAGPAPAQAPFSVN